MTVPLRPLCPAPSDVASTPENLDAFMRHCIRTRLHMVLCCSPSAPHFQRWIQQVGVCRGHVTWGAGSCFPSPWGGCCWHGACEWERGLFRCAHARS